MGLSRNLSLILGGCTALTYLAASFIPLWTVERFGRRALLMVSAAGLCSCFSMASIMLSIGTRNTAYAATAFVFLFQIFLGIGWLPIPWFYPSEVTTTRIRSRGQALGGFINWMCVFAVVQITPIAIDSINVSQETLHTNEPSFQFLRALSLVFMIYPATTTDAGQWHTFIIFAIFCFCWIPIVYCFFPETNQLMLEDIDHLFEKGGVTGGVSSSPGGKTVEPGYHSRMPNMGGIEKGAVVETQGKSGLNLTIS
ncbi:hypothetical protein VTL71DRAFT_7077 [Oculimacula yallundae]|uniref:Major facilitator superfamily (MFS) profile domain-containing protein n=1 Tax=Oculimacula yallundae TaxID=86028 RepID=A0ABR4BXC1_9HELO